MQQEETIQRRAPWAALRRWGARIGQALGNAAYDAGFWGEWAAVAAARAVCAAGRGLGRGLAGAWRKMAHPVAAACRTACRDLAAPVRRFAGGWRNLRSYVREQKQEQGAPRAMVQGAAYFRRGVKLYGHLVGRAWSYVMPLLALGLFGYTVYTVLGNNNYALAVEVNGQVVGYVQSEEVLDAAKNELQQNIVPVQEGQQWQLAANYTLAVNSGELADESTMARALLEASSSEIQPAAALYVDGELQTITTRIHELQRELEQLKAARLDPERPNLRAEFVHEVAVQEGIYFTDSIDDYSVAQDLLQNSGLLSVKTIERSVEDRAIPFETVTTESDEYAWGTTRVVQQGQDGVARVTVDYVTVDGVTTEQVLESVTVQEPVTKQIVKGTRMPVGALAEVPGYGTLMWPVPNYKYVSRWMSSHHTGADICASAGQAILAAAGGRVVTAGWHWSYGNHIVIDHGNGMRTLYAHCTQLYVSVGQTVSQGELIGAVGNTGNSFGNHCHFELYLNGVLTSARNYFPGF